MTEEQARNFIEIKLKGLWSDWEYTTAEYGLWMRTLRQCDFRRAQEELNNWYEEATSPGRKPILGRIRPFLMRACVVKTNQRETESVLLFEIVKKSNYEQGIKSGLRFAIGQRKEMPPTPESIEQESEYKRRDADILYGGEHIVVRHWTEEYEPQNDLGGE